MKKPLRATILLSGFLAVYAVGAVTLARLTASPEASAPAAVSSPLRADSAAMQKLVTFFEKQERADRTAAVLLPFGPGDSWLPGKPALWNDSLHAGPSDTETAGGDDFEAVQVTENLIDFTKDSVAELFLSDFPLSAFRLGQTLLVLNKGGTAHLIDCKVPRAPKISGTLPYQSIARIQVQNDMAYLFLRKHSSVSRKLVVLDLKNPSQPVEVGVFTLSEYASTFNLSGRQLMVFSNTRGYRGRTSVDLYTITEDLQLQPDGNAESPFLDSDFVRYGKYLLSAHPRSGLSIYDFSSPLQPKVVAEVSIPDRLIWLARFGNRLFAYGVKKQLHVVDLADPERPVWLNTIDNANHAAFVMGIDGYSYYFIDGGYLQVFPVSFRDASMYNEKSDPPFSGHPVALPGQQGFAILGGAEETNETGRTTALAWPGPSAIIDAAIWQNFMVVLDDQGALHFRKLDGSLLSDLAVIHLPMAQRWLAPSSDRLYVGGQSAVEIVALSQQGPALLPERLELRGTESWDGLVMQNYLYLAAGKSGLLRVPLKNPETTKIHDAWLLPLPLSSQIDVQQLASAGPTGMFVAAGPPGLLRGNLNDDGELLLNGTVTFATPARALAVAGETCLVATATDVSVVDIRRQDSLQKVGNIAMPGVVRFAVAENQLWAGFRAGVGWSLLPSPRFVALAADDSVLFAVNTVRSPREQQNYQLNLFNEDGVVTMPRLWPASALTADSAAGGANARD